MNFQINVEEFLKNLIQKEFKICFKTKPNVTKMVTEALLKDFLQSFNNINSGDMYAFLNHIESLEAEIKKIVDELNQPVIKTKIDNPFIKSTFDFNSDTAKNFQEDLFKAGQTIFKTTDYARLFDGIFKDTK